VAEARDGGVEVWFRISVSLSLRKLSMTSKVAEVLLLALIEPAMLANRSWSVSGLMTLMRTAS
jgi:hypothetical protein